MISLIFTWIAALNSHTIASIVILAVLFVLGIVLSALIGRRSGRRELSQRLTALGSRLGLDPPDDESNIETALSYLEQATGAAVSAVAESSADAIRLRRSFDTLLHGVVLCDENGTVVYRNSRANALMTSRHGDAIAAQAVTELLEDAWHEGNAERIIDLYGPPRRTLLVRTQLIDNGRRPLGVIALIEDISERRRLEEVRRDFVANVSHELKTPMGALGLLAETLAAEPDAEVSRRLASRIHTEAFRVTRIIDDLLDLSRIEFEEAPPREPVSVNLVMADAVERVRSTADQRHIQIILNEPSPPVAVLGDRRQLVSAMHALLENAINYSYEDSTITISGELSTDWTPPSPPLGAPSTTASASTASTTPTATLTPTPTPTPTPASPLEGNERTTTTLDNENGVTANETSILVDTPPGIHPSEHPGKSTEPSAIEDLMGTPPIGISLSEISASTSSQEQTFKPLDTDISNERTDISNERTETSFSVSNKFDDLTQDGNSPVAPDATAEFEAPVVGNQGTVRISVRDEGIGIPSRDLDRIFERFYRVDHGRSRVTGGTGLGLSIVRHVANNHQGWVEVESREGDGSTFTLVLPLQAERSQ